MRAVLGAGRTEMEIFIQKAQPRDAEAISQLYARSWREAYIDIVPTEDLSQLSDSHWTETFQKQFAAGETIGLLAYSGGMLAGAAVLSPSRDERKPDAGEIMSFYIDPAFHRQGVGTRLMKEALRQLREQGYPEAFLWVVTGNERAMAFYRSCGFAPDGDVLHAEFAGKPYLDHRYCTAL